MIPYAWFMALERRTARACSPTRHLAALRLHPRRRAHPLNPGGLPIGFALDRRAARARRSRPACLGLTCAACHTANVTVEGRPVRIDGAPAHLDLDRFYADLASAVTRTFFDPAASSVRGPRPRQTRHRRGRRSCTAARGVPGEVAGDAVIRRPTLDRASARVDALTQIINALAATDQSEPTICAPVGAPTSYPQLWLTPELEFVQWNPIAGSPIGRNGGEVLGVFGTATLSGEPQGWFSSSLRIKDLHAIETWVADLNPPRWDETLFGPIDRDLAGPGEALFRQTAPLSQRTAVPRTDPAANLFGKTFVEIGRVDYRALGTDPVYVTRSSSGWSAPTGDDRCAKGATRRAGAGGAIFHPDRRRDRHPGHGRAGPQPAGEGRPQRLPAAPATGRPEPRPAPTSRRARCPVSGRPAPISTTARCRPSTSCSRLWRSAGKCSGPAGASWTASGSAS